MFWLLRALIFTWCWYLGGRGIQNRGVPGCEKRHGHHRRASIDLGNFGFAVSVQGNHVFQEEQISIGGLANRASVGNRFLDGPGWDPELLWLVS